METTQVIQTDAEFVRRTLPAISPDSHKGSRGRLLLVCGSYGMTGACVLAARAALRCGVGLLHIAVEERIYPIVAQAVPEAVFTVLNTQTVDSQMTPLCDALALADACVIGCGLGDCADRLLPIVLQNSRVPVLCDADALNALARHPEYRALAGVPLVMTPHPGEMARLCRQSIVQIQTDRIAAATREAAARNAVLALKGPGTVIAAPNGRVAVNTTGNAGMARGGSGDVLAGMIGALLAQGVTPFEATATGVWLHGAAGDLCAQKMGIRTMLPTDLIACLPELPALYEPLPFV